MLEHFFEMLYPHLMKVNITHVMHTQFVGVEYRYSKV